VDLTSTPGFDRTPEAVRSIAAAVVGHDALDKYVEAGT
jgi:hypothetical protein